MDMTRYGMISFAPLYPFTLMEEGYIDSIPSG